MLSLQEMREKFNAQEARESSATQGPTVFNFRNLKGGDSVRIRFVKDVDNNALFWREKKVRILEFPGVIDTTGNLVEKTVYVEVPAFNTTGYKEKMDSMPPSEYIYNSSDDVIQKKIAGFWDDTESGRKLYKKFGRKVSYIFRGFLESNVQGYERNKLYRFIINSNLFEMIKSFASETSDIDVIPVDEENGLDFIINVTSKQVSIDGVTRPVNEYTTSTWARKETPLSNEEKEYLKNTNLVPLLNYIPKRPTPAQEEAMLELYEASLNNEPYDVRKWGNSYKPNNVQFDADGKLKVAAGKVADVSTSAEVKYGYGSVEEEKAVASTIVETSTPTVIPSVASEHIQNTVRVTQMIDEHTVETNTQDPKELISGIMNKYKLQQ